MKKIVLLSLLCLSAAALVSCSHDVATEGGAIHSYDSFSATIEESPSVKSRLETDGTVCWMENDQIMVFGDSDYPDYYTWDGSSSFKGPETTGSLFIALYPTLFTKEGDIMVMRNAWPTPFEASKQSWGSMPMVAKSNDNHLNFKQTVGLIHLKIKSSASSHGCNWITLKGNNDEVITGEGYINPYEDTPVYRLLPEGARKSHALQYASEEPFDFTNGLDVFFPLPESVLENGFTVSFEIKDTKTWNTVREVTKSTSKEVVIERGKMLTYSVDPASGFGEIEQEIEKEREALIAFYNALGGSGWKNNTNWCSDAPLGEWYGITTIDDHVAFIELVDNNLVGYIPEDISVFSHLLGFYIENNTGITGSIPDGLYDCTEMFDLLIGDNNLTGELSPKIGNLTKLERFTLYSNHLSGPLPKEMTQLNNLKEIMIFWNDFSGIVPSEFSDWYVWNQFWPYIIEGTNLDISEAAPYIPDFELTTLTGDTYSSSRIRQNELTMIFNWASFSTFVPAIANELTGLYEKYKAKGFDVLGVAWENYDVALQFSIDSGWPWPSYASTHTNCIGHINYPIDHTPALLAYDKSGKLVFHDILNRSLARENLSPFVCNWFGDEPDGMYESTDYSADGNVHVLQTATEGAGIDIVLMGDAYSDRQIADGTYAGVMERAMEAFFVEEPYKSYRNCFNVSYVDVVSKNEDFEGETALSTWFGEGTSVGGNDNKAYEYAAVALTPSGRTLDEVLIMVMINRDYYAGTCYMMGDLTGDFGAGRSVSYMPVSSVGDVFGQVVRHEAGGHGFAKLADEYGYTDYGTIPQSEIDNYGIAEPYGWWRNVDFTSDPAAVKWASFVADNRYASENIGVYEGACTYASGAYRPTQNSIMNDNTGGFNAPSRYAIWYRINKLAYGQSWTGSYEDFVTWDLAHRSAASARRRSAARSPEKPLPPLAPPVVIYR